jgi:transposase InsO family protein
VSGSSGHLVVEHVAEDTAESPTWPGKVFAAETLEYGRAMEQYVAETGDRLLPQREPRAIIVQAPCLWRRRQALQAERYQVREQRKQEDLTWKGTKEQWRQTRENRQALPKDVFAAAQVAWQQRRREHQALLQQRQTENQAWHARLAQLLEQEQAEAPKREWIAVLIVTDNCTRQCLGLPTFTSGAHLTSEEMIGGLREHLPPDLAYLISDQGTHFRAKVFADFAAETGFVHVPVYRHRPETNGIAERLVRTLKDWLRPATWDSYEALLSLLVAFRDEYNNRPHQGLPTPGLSPNEFANRAWVM